ncbi:class I SAM-dependent methyltransferase [Desulfovibrio litoralis]|uniref:Lysine methyltransferase n=1 Tax=Desulfovibrio litoralis DSM 11393 TaxID=1121455 RepID=A0A1M7S6X5_9BACT|nr:methyltransferase [Desulfovibrio litoralis]SHN54429.1 Lysine methyltransferase [Desulfovibrio litoralis DSM 11393]
MNATSLLPNGILNSDNLDELMACASSRYNVEFETVNAGDINLEVLQITNMQSVLDNMIKQNKIHNAIKDLPLWAKIWPASIVLGFFLRHEQNKETQTLLELGAGCGVSGLIAAKLGYSRVTISDINEEALLFAKINVLKNQLNDRVQVKFTDVAKSVLNEKYDMMIGSELLYLEELHRPIVRFFSRYLKEDGRGILIADYRRKTKHFEKLASQSFKLEQGHIGIKTKNSDENTPDKQLFSILTLQHKS